MHVLFIRRLLSISCWSAWIVPCFYRTHFFAVMVWPIVLESCFDVADSFGVLYGFTLFSLYQIRFLILFGIFAKLSHLFSLTTVLLA